MPSTENVPIGARKKRNESGYRGVYKTRNAKLKKNRWYASFRGVYLGSFDHPEDAARVYNRVVRAAGFPAYANEIPGDSVEVPELLDKDAIKRIAEQE